jgi:hypothetical protein
MDVAALVVAVASALAAAASVWWACMSARAAKRSATAAERSAIAAERTANADETAAAVARDALASDRERAVAERRQREDDAAPRFKIERFVSVPGCFRIDVANDGRSVALLESARLIHPGGSGNAKLAKAPPVRVPPGGGAELSWLEPGLDALTLGDGWLELELLYHVDGRGYQVVSRHELLRDGAGTATSVRWRWGCSHTTRVDD